MIGTNISKVKNTAHTLVGNAAGGKLCWVFDARQFLLVEMGDRYQKATSMNSAIKTETPHEVAERPVGSKPLIVVEWPEVGRSRAVFTFRVHC